MTPAASPPRRRSTVDSPPVLGAVAALPVDAPFPDDRAVYEIGRGLIDCSLTRAQWTHAAHVAAALYLLRDRPDVLPERDMPDMIRRFNLASGGANSDSEGYHETITQAWLRAGRAALQEADTSQGLAETVNRMLAGPYGGREWLLRHWSREVLFSPHARRGWVEPDLSPLPF